MERAITIEVGDVVEMWVTERSIRFKKRGVVRQIITRDDGRVRYEIEGEDGRMKSVGGRRLILVEKGVQ